MTSRVPALLGILFISALAFVATTGSAANIEITNESVAAYHQPCYHKEATKVSTYRGVTTWCEITPSLILCTSVKEPTYCTTD